MIPLSALPRSLTRSAGDGVKQNSETVFNATQLSAIVLINRGEKDRRRDRAKHRGATAHMDNTLMISAPDNDVSSPSHRGAKSPRARTR